MIIHSVTLQVQKVPPIMTRKRHVLILLEDKNHRYILGHKKMYPKGISRMIGGGVDPHETFFNAAKREVYEELRYFVPRQDLLELAEVHAKITDAEGQTYTFNTAIYSAHLDRQPLFPGDDLDGIVRLSEPEYLRLIQRYRNLPKEIDPEFNFAWYDYGQLYGPIHQLAWEAVRILHDKRHKFI